MLGQQHAAYGLQSLESTEISSVRSLKAGNIIGNICCGSRKQQVVIAHFRITLTQSEPRKKENDHDPLSGRFTAFFTASRLTSNVFEKEDIYIRRCVFNHVNMDH